MDNLDLLLLSNTNKKKKYISKNTEPKNEIVYKKNKKKELERFIRNKIHSIETKKENNDILDEVLDTLIKVSLNILENR
jgi:hypothetical protein